MALTVPEFNEREILRTALESYGLLTFDEFIKITKIPIEKLIVDRFFHSIDKKMPIYLDNNIIRYFGYEGEIWNQKSKIIKLLKRKLLKNKDKTWWEFSNTDYKKLLSGNYSLFGSKYIDVVSEPERLSETHADIPPTEKEGKKSICSDEQMGKSPKKQMYPPLEGFGNKTKHYCIMPRLFSEMLMLCGTEKGEQVRLYYIGMMEVYDNYRDYQIAFRKRSMELKDDKIDNLEKMLIESERKSNERYIKLMGMAESACIKLDESNSKLDESEASRLEIHSDNIAIKDKLGEIEILNKRIETTVKKIMPDRVIRKRIPESKHNWLLIMKDRNDKDLPYYVIRTQKCNLRNSIKKLKENTDNSDIITLIKIRHPNAMAFWEDVKQLYSANIEICDGNWFCLNDLSESRFKRKVKKLNELRKTNEDE